MDIEISCKGDCYGIIIDLPVTGMPRRGKITVGFAGGAVELNEIVVGDEEPGILLRESTTSMRFVSLEELRDIFFPGDRRVVHDDPPGS